MGTVGKRVNCHIRHSWALFMGTYMGILGTLCKRVNCHISHLWALFIGTFHWLFMGTLGTLHGHSSWALFMGTLHGYSPFSVQTLLARLDGPSTRSEVFAWGGNFPANACCRIVLPRRHTTRSPNRRREPRTRRWTACRLGGIF
jgi:hypothetical protein